MKKNSNKMGIKWKENEVRVKDAKWRWRCDKHYEKQNWNVDEMKIKWKWNIEEMKLKRNSSEYDEIW